jgi:hypothetical protein
MARPIEFETGQEQAESPLTQELKHFIDHAIVPGLLKLYFAERRDQDQVAKYSSSARQSSDDVAPRTYQEAL